MGIKPPPARDPGAPVNPNLKRKFITTTWVSAIVFAVCAGDPLPPDHLPACPPPIDVANGAQALGARRAFCPQSPKPWANGLNVSAPRMGAPTIVRLPKVTHEIGLAGLALWRLPRR
jgi:hypothetical protein